MPSGASNANNMLIGTRRPGRVEIDLQPVAISYQGDRYSDTFPFGSTTYEVPRGCHRVFHEVDRD